MWSLLRVHWRRAFPIFAVLASTLSLIVLGVVYLVEQSWFLWWCIASAALGLVGFTVSRLQPSAMTGAPLSPSTRPASAWTPRENDAWNDVVQLADRVAEAPPSNWDDVKGCAIETISTVASRLHAGKEFAAASFTFPDVLKAVELAVRDLRSQIVQRVPGSDVIELSQLLHVQKLYEQYGSIGKALWYAYRLARMLMNPLQGIAAETSGWLTNEGTQKSWHHLKGQVARSLLLELGRSAIDLYGGRLKVTEAELEQALIEHSKPSAPQAPVRIVVAGQLKSGKSSLINALMGDVRAAVSESSPSPGVAEYRLQAPDRPDLVLVDTPGLDGGAETTGVVLRAIRAADLVVWTVSAANPARDIDRRAIRELLDTFARQPNLRPPALLIAATCADRLPPRREWAPPYDVTKPVSEKEINIRAALDQISAELLLQNSMTVPIAMPPNEVPYNLESLWVAIYFLLDDARQTALRRALEERPGFSVSKAVRQVLGGGRYLGRIVFDRASEGRRQG